MIKRRKSRPHNTVHIAGRGSVVRQLRILASQFRVLPDRNELRNPQRQLTSDRYAL